MWPCVGLLSGETPRRRAARPPAATPSERARPCVAIPRRRARSPAARLPALGGGLTVLAVADEATVAQPIPREEVSKARERIEALQRITDKPLTGARIAVRETHAARPFVVDAGVVLDDHVVAAHTTGRAPDEAIDEAIERLRRQVLRITKSEVARRNDPLDLSLQLRPQTQLKPPRERNIVHRHPYLRVALPTLDAVDELLDLDLQFFLFEHARTHEDVTVHRRDDGGIGLLHPQGSKLADENDVVTPEPSRYEGPITLEKARAEMDWLNHRFLYFVDAADNLGKVIYLRHDGDYGLVEPHA
jgi:ribosome-associated translation inhibitor RaiA